MKTLPLLVSKSHRNLVRLFFVVASSVFLISGCGDDKPSFNSLIVFGSSLSDVGSYKAGAIAAVGGGRSTVNPGKIWVEHMADTLGTAIKPGMVGFAGAPVICPQAPCTGWAQGGARITNPAGAGKSLGILTVPLTQQMDQQLLQKSAYTLNDLVVVASGPNDVYELAKTLPTAVASLVAGGQTQSAAQAQVIASINTLVIAAGNELVDLIDKKILAKGAGYVVVLTNDDILGTPTALAAETQLAGSSLLISQWIKLLNDTVAAGISTKKLAVLTVNTNDLTKLVLAKPADYGIANSTTPACDPAKIAIATGGLVTDGNSLVCTLATLRTGASADTWLYADATHYANRMHKLIADYVADQLRAQGWL